MSSTNLMAVFLLQSQSVFLSQCDLTFSHSCKCKKQQQREEKLHQGAGKGGWKEREEGMKKEKKNRDYFPALSAANPSFTPHKNIWRLSVAQPYTSGYSHTLKVTQTRTTRKHTLTNSLCPLRLSDSMKSALHWRWGALVCFTPTSPSSLLSSILHGPALLWGPIRALCRSMACG